MNETSSDVAFTPTVKRIQTERDSVYLATANADGQAANGSDG